MKSFKAIFFVIALFLCNEVSAQKVEIIEGKFEFNALFNEPFNADSIQRLNLKKRLDSMDMQKMNQYIQIMFSADTPSDFDRANTIKNSDPFFKSLPERGMFMFYSLYEVYRLGLLFNPTVTLSEDFAGNGGTKNIYLNSVQFKNIVEAVKSNKTIKIAVEQVGEAKLTRFKIYRFNKLLDN